MTLPPHESHALDRLLHTRTIEPASPFWIERILTASRHMTQAMPLSLGQWLAELYAEYIALKPAYTFAALLLLGVTLGISTADMLTPHDSNASPLTQIEDGAIL